MGFPSRSGGPGPGSRRSRAWRWPLWAVASLLPTLLVLAAGEAAVRLLDLDRPRLRVQGVPGEERGLLRPDEDLFWALVPGLRRAYEGAVVTTNASGLRGAEIPPPGPGQLRILSLGESSTFGVGVGDDETYTARLAGELAGEDRTVVTMNAGVPAWSSFQSLRFLETRGLALRPDLVLFYHELNDYLPSSLRDSSRSELGALRTDRELHASRLHRLDRRLRGLSALYRFASQAVADLRIRRFRDAERRNPLLDIGLPDIGIAPRLLTAEGRRRAVANEWALGRRVSDAERRDHLERLLRLSQQHGFRLVVIHPSYAHSAPHECLLTRFCERADVPCFDAHPTLHPEGSPPGALFHDSMHPGREGHERLARDLAAFLERRGVVLASGSS